MKVRPSVYTYDLKWDLDDPLTIQVLETEEATLMFGGGKAVTAEQQIEIGTRHDIDIVVVEHGDGDHFEAIPRMQEELDFDVAAPEGDILFVEGERSWDRTDSKRAIDDSRETGVSVDIPLESGRTYWGGVEAIAAPGHTFDNMSFLYKDVLFTGDTVVGRYDRADEETNWSGELAMLAPEQYVNVDEAYESVRGLLEYSFETVLVTHGNHVLEGGYEAMETLVSDINALTE
jgi:glyoxylase-like metal-dependent hydrolase (beta-lactamase superfamily II)